MSDWLMLAMLLFYFNKIITIRRQVLVRLVVADDGKKIPQESNASVARNSRETRLYICMHVHTYACGTAEPSMFFKLFKRTCHAWGTAEPSMFSSFQFSKFQSELSCMRIEGRQSPRFVYVWLFGFVKFCECCNVVLAWYLFVCMFVFVRAQAIALPGHFLAWLQGCGLGGARNGDK